MANPGAPLTREAQQAETAGCGTVFSTQGPPSPALLPRQLPQPQGTQVHLGSVLVQSLHLFLNKLIVSITKNQSRLQASLSKTLIDKKYVFIMK